MGQPKVASATWRARNKRISRDSYEPVGQQERQTMASKTHVGVRCCKNSKLRFEMNDKIPSQTVVESVGFFPYGTGVIWVHCSEPPHVGCYDGIRGRV